MRTSRTLQLVGLVPLLALVLSAATSRAESLVDTGPGGASSIGAASLFNDVNGSGSFQFLAGRFELSNDAVVDQLQGWMGPFSFAGDLDVRIRADASGSPGETLYTKIYAVPFRGAAGWESFGGFAAALPAGTYWASFEPTSVNGYSANMPEGAPSPLSGYAFSADGNPGYLSFGASFGMRVDGLASQVVMGTAARATYREDLPINGDPNGLFAQAGGNGEMATGISVGNGAGRGGMIPDGLEAGAFARGFTDAPNPIAQHNGVGTGHGIAWRPFHNASAEDRTFRISGVLDGGANNAFGTLSCQVDVRISALDPLLLAQLVQASGGDAAQYLLDKHTGPGAYAPFPASSVLTDFVSYDQFNADDSGFQPRQRDLDTNVFTVGPGESFVLVFDVYVRATGTAFGGGEGVLDYLDTLRPAADLFTDAGGQPVPDIVAGSTPVPEPGFEALLGIGVLTMAWRSRRSAPRSSKPRRPTRCDDRLPCRGPELP